MSGGIEHGMEEGELDVVEEHRGKLGETGSQGERVSGEEVNDRQEEEELAVYVFQL